MSFALNSVTNTLPSPDNLKRWGKRVVSKCPLCQNTGTLEHILNFCPVALTQKRYNYRHDSVLNHLTSVIIANKPENIEVYADIPGFDLNGSTIPPDILVTLSRPDLVIVNRSNKTVDILELTCSFERNILAAHQRKTTKYISLKADIESAGFACSLLPFEIGSRGRGHVRKQTKTREKFYHQHHIQLGGCYLLLKIQYYCTIFSCKKK